MDLLLSAVAGGTGLVAVSAVAFTKLRPYFSVRVNCWFCNADTKVPYRRKDSFVCHQCKQYNGFSEDGDYNCDLPAQYCESLNSPPSKPRQPVQQSGHTPGLSLGNGLCQTCNLYQAMKVKALSEFEPSHPDKFDEEVEIYEQRLERLYGGLCRLCSQTLKCTLGEQDSWLKPKLIHWRLQQSMLLKNLLTPMHNGLSRRSHMVSTILRIFCVMAACSVLFSAVISGLSGVNDDTSDTSGSFTSAKSNPKINTSRQDSAVEDSLTETWLSWVPQQQLVWGARRVREHQAGLVITSLSLLLAAICVAGKNLLKAWDAAGCLMLVVLLSLCCWQDSSQLLLHLLPQVTQLHLSHAKLLCSGLCCLLVVGGLVASSRPPPPPQRTRTPRHTSARDLSQDSILSEESLNSSQDCSSSSVRAFSPAVSTAAPSLVSSNGGPPASMVTHPPGAPTPSNPSLHLHGGLNQDNNGGFYGQHSARPSGNGQFNCSTPTSGGLLSNSVFGPSNGTVKPSAPAGDSLDSSLGSLQIGTPAKKSPGAMDPRNAFLQERSQNVHGMTLRGKVGQQARAAHNINGIAQSSWVAGGYWGSPTKSNRSPGLSPNSGSVPSSLFQQHPAAGHLQPDAFLQSRSSSQSSGFVSHGSGSQLASDAGHPQRNFNFPAAYNNNNNLDNNTDRVSVASEPGFRWNYESCETSSQGSQNLQDEVASVTGARRRTQPSSASALSYAAASDARSVFSTATGPPSQYSSAASSLLTAQQMWQLQHQQQRSPFDDLQAMRALSRLSQHDVSDDDLSILSRRSLDGVLAPASPVSSTTHRNPWVAFILGMSVMANGFLALVLYKNGTLAELLL